MTISSSLPPNPTSVPTPLPKGSWDTHFHVFPPGYALSATPPFIPSLFPTSQADGYFAALGIEKTVAVHSFAFGQDVSSTLDYVGDSPPLRRGVGALAADATPEQIQKLDSRGIKGVRAPLGANDGHAAERAHGIKALAERLDAAGVRWTVLVQDFDPTIFAALLAIIDEIPASQTLIIDHLGYLQGPWSGPAPALVPAVTPEDVPGLAQVLRLLRDHNVFIKLSAPFRSTTNVATLEPLIQQLAQTPSQLLWASDFPFVPLAQDIARLKAEGKGSVPAEWRCEDMPQWLTLLRGWLGEEAFTKMMVENPERVYGASS